jgi:hypothetical protein
LSFRCGFLGISKLLTLDFLDLLLSILPSPDRIDSSSRILSTLCTLISSRGTLSAECPFFQDINVVLYIAQCSHLVKIPANPTSRLIAVHEEVGIRSEISDIPEFLRWFIVVNPLCDNDRNAVIMDVPPQCSI